MLCFTLPQVHLSTFHHSKHPETVYINHSLVSYIDEIAAPKTPFKNLGNFTNGETLLQLKLMEINSTFNLANPKIYQGDILASMTSVITERPPCGVIVFENVHTLPMLQFLYILCSVYTTVQLYNPILNYSAHERFVICTGFKQHVRLPDPPYSFIPHQYFLLKVEELNAIFGQQQLENLRTDKGDALCAEWRSRFYKFKK
jgi:hypothetical protein